MRRAGLILGLVAWAWFWYAQGRLHGFWEAEEEYGGPGRFSR